MALEFAHGALQLTTGSIGTTFTVSGLSFQPKALRFYWVGIDSATDATTQTVNGRCGVGFAVSTSERRAVGDVNMDNTSSAVCAAAAINTGVVVTLDGSTNAINGIIDLDAINSDGFDLIVDDVLPDAMTLFWEAWGGDDITVAVVGDIAEPASVGDVDYTVTGFVGADTDQVVMFAGCQSTAAVNSGAGTDSGISVGFASGGAADNNIGVTGTTDDGSLTMDTDGFARRTWCISRITVGGGSVNARAQLTQFGTDNFRLNWAERLTTDRRSIFMAIKGGSWEVGSYTINGNSGSATATVSGLSFTPKGVSLLGRGTTENSTDTSAAGDRYALGSGSSTSSRRTMGYYSEHGTGNAEPNLCVQYDQVLAFPSTTGTLQSAFDINAMNSDGFQIIVDTAGGVASEWQGYLTFGDAPAAGDPEIDAQPGSFAVTGVAATVVAGRVVDAQPGAFTLTGVLATLSRGFFVDAQPGSFSLTGFTAALLTDRVIDAQPGAYVVTGAQAELVLGKILDAQPGVFTLIGFDADLVYVSGGASFEIDAQPGAFTITGNETAIVAGRALNAEAGSLAIVGADAGELAARVLEATPGAFVITGSDAQTLVDRVVNAETGIFAVTGFDAELDTTVQYVINAEPGVYTITGIETWGALNFEQFPSVPLGSRLRFDLATGQLVLVINDKLVMSL